MKNTQKKEKLGQAEKLLIANGISREDAPDLLRAIGYALTDRDIYSPIYDDRRDIARAMRDALLLTSNAGMSSGNALYDMKYIPEREVIRPIFEDGTGSDGSYDINVAGDSGTAVIVDIARQFVSKMW